MRFRALGCVSFANSRSILCFMIAANLVDEFRVWIYPVVRAQHPGAFS
jgi:hypothetical protein